jgi:hypothetical protein
MVKIFVSYSRQDKDQVYGLSNTLRARGITVWTDVTGIRGGAVWQYEIEQAILNCDVMVVMWSSAARESHWVKREIIFALDCHRPIIPVLLDEARLSLSLIDIQPIDYTENQEQGLAQLIQALPDNLVPDASLPATDERLPATEGANLVAFRRQLQAHEVNLKD